MYTIDKNLIQIIRSLKASYGSDFFNSLTSQLHQLIKADYTFIAVLDKQRYVSTTISLVAKGNIADNFEYSLTDTPCANVSDNSICIYPQNICGLFPHDQLLIDMKIEGYLGTPLLNSDGEVIGLVVGLYETPITNADDVVALFELFSGRISAELEREDKEKQLKQLNLEREDKVKLRTQELSQAIDKLKFTQEKLIEKEKMASLGNLVTGVAHEINTPLGIAILSSSTIDETIAKLLDKLHNRNLTKSELESLLSTLKLSEETVTFNLQRAANLVDNFKEMAAGANNDELTQIHLDSWLNALVSSLTPTLNKNNITVTLDIPDPSINLNTYPSKMSQVLTNIITNCADHAFDIDNEQADQQINITTQITDEQLTITISDNGKGMSEKIKKHIFDPFYTTNRGQGATGLGLSIVHNIVKNNLNGDLHVTSTLNEGTAFHLTLPLFS